MLMLCRAEAVLEGRHTFTVDTLLGRRDEASLMVCARHMAEKLSDAGCSRQETPFQFHSCE